jgi:LacI family transcriptional regulator
MKPKNIRIKDIASLAGVSEGTVDRVIHNRGKVSKAATDKINRVLAEIDYTPNLLARTLGTNRIFRLACVIPNPESDPYWKQSYDGIRLGEEELSQFGISVLMEFHFYDPHRKQSFQDVTLKAFHSKPDGILVAPLFYYASLPFFKVLSESKIPFIIFNTNLKEVHPLSFIGQDLFQSGRLAAELISVNHAARSCYVILHIDEDLSNSVHLIEKEKGFKHYFNNDLATEHIQVKSYTLPDASHVLFEKELDSILKIPDLKGICVSNSKVHMVAKQLELQKISIPLIGYDLLDENIRFLKRGIIRFIIHQNPKRQAKLGIRALANFLVLGKKPPEQNLFPLEIITRNNIDSYQL